MDTIIHTDSKNIFRKYFDLAYMVLLEPSNFFRREFGVMSWPEALSFGVLSGWIASMMGFFWETANTLFLFHFVDKWMQKFLDSEDAISVLAQNAQSVLWGAGAAILAPFFILVKIFFSTVMIYFLAKFLIPSRSEGDKITYMDLVKVAGISQVGSWFLLVPLFGSPLAFIARLVLMITGVRERYGISTRRSTAVVLGPYLFLLTMALMVAILFVLLLTQIPLDELVDPGM